VLKLDKNELDGVIRSHLLSDMVQLREIHLQDNKLVGGFPDLSQLQFLEELKVEKNKLEGTLPGNIIGQLTSLRKLKVSENNFNGPVPSDALARLTNLEELSLKRTDLTGEVSDDVCRLGIEKIELDCREVRCRCFTKCSIECGGNTGVPCPGTKQDKDSLYKYEDVDQKHPPPPKM